MQANDNHDHGQPTNAVATDESNGGSAAQDTNSSDQTQEVNEEEEECQQQQQQQQPQPQPQQQQQQQVEQDALHAAALAASAVAARQGGQDRERSSHETDEQQQHHSDDERLSIVKLLILDPDNAVSKDAVKAPVTGGGSLSTHEGTAMMMDSTDKQPKTTAQSQWQSGVKPTSTSAQKDDDNRANGAAYSLPAAPAPAPAAVAPTGKLRFLRQRQKIHKQQGKLPKDKEEAKEEITLSHDDAVTIQAVDEEDAQPGAFAATPRGGNWRRNDNLRFSVLGRNAAAERRAVAQPTAPTISTITAGLVVANPVPEDTLVLPLAHEIYHNEIHHHRRNMMRNNTSSLGVMVGLGMLVLVMVAVVLAVVLTSSNNNKQADNAGASNATQLPTLSPKEYVAKLLPPYTLQTMQDDPLSPQSEALEFVIQDPQLYNYSDWRIQQRFALATLFFAMDGRNWKGNDGWMDPTTHECLWFTKPLELQTINRESKAGSWIKTDKLSNNYSGNPCEEEDPNNIQQGKYYHLCQQGNELNGTLPPEVFELLPSLKSVNLDPQGAVYICDEKSDNCGYQTSRKISGTLPSEVGYCTDMEVLSVEYHGLVGTLPSTLALMTSLRKLRLHGNLFSGSLPSAIGSMVNLEFLALGENNLNGTIPSAFMQMSYLTYLDLDLNHLGGTIHTAIGLMSSLTSLSFYGNGLSGTIPSVMGHLPSLTSLSLGSNALRGTIPNEIAQMSQLAWLSLASNQLSAAIPSEVGLMSSLTYLDLTFNALNGTIPSELGLMSSLTILSLPHNSIRGTIPSEIGLMSSLMQLTIASNQMSGSIPSEIQLISRLTGLYLSENQLNGTLPSEIGVMSSLTSLALDHNNLNGVLPSEIGLMSSLQSLYLSYNNLTGNIPSEVGLLSGLATLGLFGNFFTADVIPSGLVSLAVNGSLSVLGWHENENLLSGTIPDALCAIFEFRFNCTVYLCGCNCSCAY